MPHAERGHRKPNPERTPRGACSPTQSSTSRPQGHDPAGSGPGAPLTAPPVLRCPELLSERRPEGPAQDGGSTGASVPARRPPSANRRGMGAHSQSTCRFSAIDGSQRPTPPSSGRGRGTRAVGAGWAPVPPHAPQSPAGISRPQRHTRAGRGCRLHATHQAPGHGCLSLGPQHGPSTGPTLRRCFLPSRALGGQRLRSLGARASRAGPTPRAPPAASRLTCGPRQVLSSRACPWPGLHEPSQRPPRP